MKWRFFTRDIEMYRLLVTNDKGGYYFDRNGESYQGDIIGVGWHNKYADNKVEWNEFKEISLEKALETILTKEGRDNFLNILKISRYKIVPLNETIINNYISILNILNLLFYQQFKRKPRF